MKRKFSIGWWLLLGFIMATCAVGLGGCCNDDDDEDLKGDVYKGRIEELGPKPGYFTVRVTHSPYKPGDNGKGEFMPYKKDFLYIEQATCADFDIKEGKTILFRVISTEQLPVLNNYIPEYFVWDCEIEVLKLY